MNRRFTFGILAIVVAAVYLILFGMKEENGSTVNIGKSEITIEDGVLTPEVLWAMGRIGGVAVSPDGSMIVYQVSYYSVEENASHTVLYVMTDKGEDVRMLTGNHWSEHSPAWLDNERIAFLSNESGSQQIWVTDTKGKRRSKLSDTDRDVEGFLFSPDLSKVLMVMSVPNPSVKEVQYADLPSATGRIADDLMFRHWDHNLFAGICFSRSSPATYSYL
jgi:dipeptidyl aminopeptidase/acylaminoacyl peptidase